jgi:ribosomal protein S7
MLSKEFVKYRTEAHVEQYKEPFRQEFSDKYYLLFVRKFRGSMISRGKSSLSYKFFDRIWILLKKFMREQEHPQDTEKAFRHAIFNLIPILSTSNIKKGKRVQVLPVMLKHKRRIVLINK